MNINKVTLHIDYKTHFENFLKNNIISIHTIGLSYDGGPIYKNFPAHTELIDDIDKSLFTIFFEFLFNRFGKDKEYFYSEDNEGYNLRTVRINHSYNKNICNLDLIQNIFNLHNVPENKLLIQTSNLNAEKDWPYDFKLLKAFPTTIFSYTPKEYTTKIFNKKFIFLNRNHKLHRCWLYEQFNEMNILDNFYYSINAENNPAYPISITLDNDNSKNIDIALNENENYLNKSFCNIVTESEFYSNEIHNSAYKTIMITEKTMKAINNFQPFILVSGYKSLAKLKEFGFKTFDKWWDESYDNEEDDSIRLHQILKLVVSLNKLSFNDMNKLQNEMKDILIHNSELYTKFIDTKYNYSVSFASPYNNYNCFL
jgi:hypothetical protein